MLSPGVWSAEAGSKRGSPILRPRCTNLPGRANARTDTPQGWRSHQPADCHLWGVYPQHTRLYADCAPGYGCRRPCCAVPCQTTAGSICFTFYFLLLKSLMMRFNIQFLSDKRFEKFYRYSWYQPTTFSRSTRRCTVRLNSTCTPSWLFQTCHRRPPSGPSLSMWCWHVLPFETSIRRRRCSNVPLKDYSMVSTCSRTVMLN